MEWPLSVEAPQELARANGINPAFSAPAARNHDFEAYVYAALQCGGWFVEPNPREMDLVHEFLFELDAVARKPFGDPGARLLAVEAKSGNWSPKDTLLLVGRGEYIGAEGGVFAYRKFSQHTLEERITRRLSDLGFCPLRFPDTDHPSATEVIAIIEQALRVPVANHHGTCYPTWLFAHLLQARMRVSWKQLRALHPASAAIEAARQWDRQVYESLPLVASPVERLGRQQEAFNDFGRVLASRVADDLGLTGDYGMGWAVLHEGGNKWVQAALLLQHTARLAIFTTLIEIAALTPAPEVTALISGTDDRLPDRRWRSRLADALNDKNSGRWPLLWQTYLGCWGGFLVPERRDEELAMLAQEAGMNAADAEPALAAFDSFFPIADGGSWHGRANGVDLLKFFPAAMHGVGVLHRLHRFGLYRQDGAGRVQVAQILRDEYGASEEAAATMRTWYDAGAATLLRRLS
jgi:hypothetical protein